MVRSTAAWASATTRSRTTRMSSVSDTAVLPAAAASRTTVRIVPSVGFMTARYATAAASLSAAATPCASIRERCATPWAKPRRICDRITPLLPRAPMSDPCAAAARTESTAEGAGASPASSTADRSVRYMFEPVSPSGTGKTLRSLISCWFASSQESAAVRPLSTCSPPTSRSGSRSTDSSGAGLVAGTVALRMNALDVDVHCDHGQAEGLFHRVTHRAHQIVRDLADAGPVLRDDVELDDEPVGGDLDLDPAMDVLPIEAFGDPVGKAAGGHPDDAVALVGGMTHDRGDHTGRDLDSSQRRSSRQCVGRADLAFHVSP